jgi:DNA-binding NtrC family response regulator
MARKQKTVLIVDDDDSARAALTTPLKSDYHVVSALSAEEAIATLREQTVNVVLVDVRQPGISGFELLQIVKENYADVEVIMISAVDEIETVVQSMKHGAFHYVTKDMAPDALQSLVRLAVERQELSRQIVSFTAQVADQDAPELVIGSSKPLRDIVGLVDKVSQLSATVLILGESGTGKELLARLIHRKSNHASGPFIPINLAAIPADLVESTLFGHERGSFTGAHRQQLGKFELATGGTPSSTRSAN